MSHYADLLASLKEYRRNFADQLDQDMDLNTRKNLAETHMCILAIEAIIAEPPVEKTGPSIEFGADGYPK